MNESRRAVTGRRVDGYIYATLGAVFAAAVFAGFSRTYYLKYLFAAPPLPSMVVHLHGLVMSAWVVLFLVQISLVETRRVRLHQRLGYAGIALGVVMLVLGVLTALGAARHGSRSTPEGFSQPTFAIVPLGDLVMFAMLFGGAIYFRRTPARHKALMFLTAVNFLPPAIGRLPMGGNPAVFVGISVALAITCVVIDTWRRRRVDAVVLGAALMLIASFPVRIALIATPGWAHTAAWLATLVD